MRPVRACATDPRRSPCERSLVRQGGSGYSTCRLLMKASRFQNDPTQPGGARLPGWPEAMKKLLPKLVFLAATATSIWGVMHLRVVHVQQFCAGLREWRITFHHPDGQTLKDRKSVV